MYVTFIYCHFTEILSYWFYHWDFGEYYCKAINSINQTGLLRLESEWGFPQGCGSAVRNMAHGKRVNGYPVHQGRPGTGSVWEARRITCLGITWGLQAKGTADKDAETMSPHSPGGEAYSKNVKQVSLPWLVRSPITTFPSRYLTSESARKSGHFWGQAQSAEGIKRNQVDPLGYPFNLPLPKSVQK